MAAGRFGVHPHLGTVGRKLQRVREQVAQHLLEAGAVDLDLKRIDGQVELDAACAGVGADCLHRGLQQRREGMSLQVELQLAGDQAVEVEQVIDQQAQAPAVVAGDLQQAPRRVGDLLAAGAHHQAQCAGDRGQRRTQFVAHHRDQFVLQPRRTLAFGGVFRQRPHQVTAAGVLQGEGAQPYRLGAAVTARQQHVQRAAATVAGEITGDVGDGLIAGGQQQVGMAPAQQFIAAPSARTAAGRPGSLPAGDRCRHR